MPLPNAATKVELDQATDDPRSARLELADLVDKFNALLTHLGLSSLTSTPATVGDGLEVVSSALRARLNGSTLLRSGSGLSVNTGAGASQIVQLDSSGRLTVGTVVAAFDAQQQFRASGVITPTQITANQNNYNPTGLSTASRARISSDAARNITGLAGGAEGREIRLTNIGSFTITLTDQDASSTAANRFSFGADFDLLAGKSVLLFYDDTLDRWLTDDAASTGAGAWSVLAQEIAANVAAVDFSLVAHLTDFEAFEVECAYVVPVTDTVNLLLRTSSDGGSTFAAGGSDYYRNVTGQSVGGIIASIDATAPALQLNRETLGNATGESFSATIRIRRPAQSAKYTQIEWSGAAYTSLARTEWVQGAGHRLAAADVDAIRILFSSGNISAGVFTLLGRRKAA